MLFLIGIVIAETANSLFLAEAGGAKEPAISSVVSDSERILIGEGSKVSEPEVRVLLESSDLFRWNRRTSS